MPLSLNQVQTRIQQICLGHKQIRSFFYGLKTDWLTTDKVKYPAVFLDDNGGTISPKGHSVTLAWRIWFLDLVDVAAYTDNNTNEVASDMLSVAIDIMTQLNRDSNGWVLSDGNIQQVEEDDNDMPWGVYVDFTIKYPYPQNNCEVPTNTIVP